MSDEFKSRLIEHAKAILSRAERASSEEATRQYLILPFFQLLGYDPLNPDEIVPETEASFSDKFRNKVDYAILKDGHPVIAVECKKAGAITEANRGELKGYFNAVQSVKLGMLTDGLVYELFSDTDNENMMDDEPFARLDLRTVAEERIDPAAFDAISYITKSQFEPANIGAEARRKLFLASYIDSLDQLLAEPGDALVRELMDMAQVHPERKRTTKLIHEHKPLVKEAVQMYMDRKILERVGFANRQDLVRTSAITTEGEAKEEGAVDAKSRISEIETTEAEMHLYDYVCKRLSFLVKEESLFDKIENVRWVDHKTVFSVYYKQERKGRLFQFWHGTDPKYRLQFADEEQSLETNDLHQTDEALLRLFEKRVAELG